MNKSLQAQILKLEEAFNESSSVGVTLQDDIRAAILLKCVSGNLRTQLNMVVSDTTTYAQIRENILKFERSQQKWSATLALGTDSNDTSGPSPMDVDRVGFENQQWGSWHGSYNNQHYNSKGKHDKANKGKGKDKHGKKGKPSKGDKGKREGKGKASNTTRGGISNGNTAANGSNSHTMTKVKVVSQSTTKVAKARASVMFGKLRNSLKPSRMFNQNPNQLSKLSISVTMCGKWHLVNHWNLLSFMSWSKIFLLGWM